jgi:hypothetical protein
MGPMGFGKRFSFAFSVTTYVPAVAITSGGMIALGSSFETKRVGSGSPFDVMRRWNVHISPSPRTFNTVGPEPSIKNRGAVQTPG